MLLDGLGIGPQNLRRRENHQIDGRLAHLTLKADVDALVDLFIALVGECGTVDCTLPGTPHRDFLDASLQQGVGLLTAPSWSKFVGGLDLLTSATVDAQKLLNTCECIAERGLEEVYRYMTEVVDVSVALRRLCRQIDMSETKADGVQGQPIVVDLTRLLKALGIEGRSGLVVDNLGLGPSDDI
jgi:hypothetical protein